MEQKSLRNTVDRLRVVGYVGGKHLVSVDADYCILALFMDTTACEGYL